MIDWYSLRDTSGVSILLAVAAELGMGEDECLHSTRIVSEQLDEPLASIHTWQELALVRNIQEFRGSDEGLGLMVAQRFVASDMGMFGQALASCDSLKQARDLLVRYQLMGMSFSRFAFSSEGRHLRLTLEDVNVPVDCKRFCEERGLAACQVLFSDLLGFAVKPEAVTMRLPAPANLSSYRECFGVDIRFNAPTNSIVFDRAIDSAELPTANRKLRLASIRFCDEVIAAQQQSRTTEGRVRALLQERGLATDMDFVAQQLAVSSRQLRRQLAAESTSFRAIQQQARFDIAAELLASGMSVNDVALNLGYTGAASFSRAFKKHTGASPSRSKPGTWRG